MRSARISDRTIQSICRCIVRTLRPLGVILFGSYAEGNATVDSDLDFLVILPEKPSQRWITPIIQDHLPQSQKFFSLDVFAMSREEFEETRSIIGGIAYPAAKYGRVLYEKS